MSDAAVSPSAAPKRNLSDIALDGFTFLLLFYFWVFLISAPISFVAIIILDPARWGLSLPLFVLAGGMFGIYALVSLFLFFLAKKLSERRTWCVVLCAILLIAVSGLLLVASINLGITHSVGMVTLAVLLLAIGILFFALALRRPWQDGTP